MENVEVPQTPHTETSKTSKNRLPIIAGILGGFAILGVFANLASQRAGEMNKKTESDPSTATKEKANVPATSPTASLPTNSVETISPPAPKMAPAEIPTGATYQDGTYEADGAYQSPAGPEAVHLAITLKDGVVTESVFTATSEAPKSQMFQGQFIKNYKPLVVGKKIDEINLTVVSGSSLTPKGFQDALAKIAAEAKM